jgi:hypothetical protein
MVLEAIQIGHDGEDTPVVVGRLETEPLGNRSPVLGRSPLGNDRQPGDGEKGPALGHQSRDYLAAPCWRWQAVQAGAVGQTCGARLG